MIAKHHYDELITELQSVERATFYTVEARAEALKKAISTYMCKPLGFKPSTSEDFSGSLWTCISCFLFKSQGPPFCMVDTFTTTSSFGVHLSIAVITRRAYAAKKAEAERQKAGQTPKRLLI